MNKINEKLRKSNLHYKNAVKLLLFIHLSFSGCSSNQKIEQQSQEDLPVDSLYNQALDTVYSGNPKQAASMFEEVERQHP